ncbi:hypothetical protein BLNAU_9487 [Blattamonas nauphoetae]|uniref:Cilia- and flagella-associated protein 157 n=1 Tax=Blattamonas nauphoetae TaxID=2049346 RepID=A0ABQ9XVX3_9EUKA|nr:hypothetical protein BLNAU_9487 [Blattamonas nauphoetae]
MERYSADIRSSAQSTDLRQSRPSHLSLFEVMREKEAMIEERNKTITDMNARILELKKFIHTNKSSSLERQNLEEMNQDLAFQNQNLINEITLLQQQLGSKQQELVETTEWQREKDKELEQLKATHRAEFEAIQEFVESHAQMRMMIDEAKETKKDNEEQVKILQLRRDQLLNRLEVIRLAFESQNLTSFPAIPKIPNGVQEITDDEEIVAGVFGELVNDLKNRMLQANEMYDELMDEKKEVETDLDEQIMTITKGSLNAIEKHKSHVLEQRLLNERKRLENSMELQKKGKLRQVDSLGEIIVDTTRTKPVPTMPGLTIKVKPKPTPKTKYIGPKRKATVKGPGGTMLKSVSQSRL